MTTTTNDASKVEESASKINEVTVTANDIPKLQFVKRSGRRRRRAKNDGDVVKIQIGPRRDRSRKARFRKVKSKKASAGDISSTVHI